MSSRLASEEAAAQTSEEAAQSVQAAYAEALAGIKAAAAAVGANGEGAEALAAARATLAREKARLNALRRQGSGYKRERGEQLEPSPQLQTVGRRRRARARKADARDVPSAWSHYLAPREVGCV